MDDYPMEGTIPVKCDSSLEIRETAQEKDIFVCHYSTLTFRSSYMFERVSIPLYIMKIYLVGRE